MYGVLEELLVTCCIPSCLLVVPAVSLVIAVSVQGSISAVCCHGPWGAQGPPQIWCAQHKSTYMHAELPPQQQLSHCDHVRYKGQHCYGRDLLLLLLLYWIRALPDRPVGSQTRLIGQH
jgi:hypothetical protein